MSKVCYVFNWIVVHLPLRQLSSLTHLHLAITGLREEETCHRHHHSLLHSFTPRCLHFRSLHANKFTLAWLHARCLHALMLSHLHVLRSPCLKVFTYLQKYFCLHTFVASLYMPSHLNISMHTPAEYT